MIKIYILPVLVLFLLSVAVDSSAAPVAAVKKAVEAGYKLGKRLKPDDLKDFRALFHEQGVKGLGSRLSEMKLAPDEVEKIYLLLAVDKKLINPLDANFMLNKLGGVDGFAATLRKLLGNNPMGSTGHIYELKLATAAANDGFTVVAIGKKFSDGVKKSLTDIDVLLERNGKLIAIEAKDYAVSTLLPMDKFRADMDSLNQFRLQQNTTVIPVFSIRKMPSDTDYKRLYQAAESRKVQLIVGEPAGQVEKIKILEELL
jgi:hypothetical protein